MNRPGAPRLKSGADRLNLNGPSSARRDFRPTSANPPQPEICVIFAIRLRKAYDATGSADLNLRSVRLDRGSGGNGRFGDLTGICEFLDAPAKTDQLLDLLGFEDTLC